MKEKTLLKRIKTLEEEIKDLKSALYKYGNPEMGFDVFSGTQFITKKPSIEEQISLIMERLSIRFHHEVKDKWEIKRI